MKREASSLRPDGGSLPRTLLTAACFLLLGSVPVLAQQFIDETATRFPVPNPTDYSNQATIGDLDNDGDLDIVWANGSAFTCPGPSQIARVYINDGSGVFTDETSARTGNLSGRHRGAELGDCDNDGDLDLVLAQDCNNLPNLLINDGSGTFSSEGGTRLPAITLASSRGQFGDVDNDGDLDLFFTSGSSSRFTCGQYRLYINDGTCNYTDATGTLFPTGNVCNNMDCIFGDIDNDFDIDIRTASTGTNNSRLYRNDGTGAFTSISVPADSTCYSYDFGDIDGDGDLDLLGANAGPGSTELMLENDGAGNYTNVSSQISPNPNQDDNDTKFIDFDNDGDLDMIIGRIGGPEKSYRNDGAGNFVQVGAIQAINDSTLDIMVADLTGDGAYDIITAQGESGNFQNRIYRNTGAADTIPPTIVDTEQVVNADDAGPYVVRTLILDHMTSDRNFFDKGIDLNYSVDAGPDQSVPMRHSGGQVYRGEIPGQPAGSSVEYWVTAKDWNENLTTGPTLTFGIPNCAAVSNCSGNGTCVADDTCDCDPGWTGPDCSTFDAIEGGEVSTLSVRKGPGTFRLQWTAGCGVDDDDYAVYAGTIGDFTSHVPLVCSTGGSVLYQFSSVDSEYYLVVPTTFNAEGSYGQDSTGTERPASTAACAPQAIDPCN